MSADQLPDYDQLERSLRAMDALGAAEAHGVIAGVLSGPKPSAEAWVKSIFAGIDASVDSATAERPLGELRVYTEARLAERESDFNPLLPGDEASFAERVGALADFCRGYVLGLVAGGIRDLNELPGDAREVVNDFLKIAEAETDGDGTEVEEQAFADLTEYVRVGVQLVYEELHAND